MYSWNDFFVVILDYIRLKALYELEPTLYDYDKEILWVGVWDNVSVHYTGYLDDGTQFDSSYDRWVTLDFTVWDGQMISGFDSAVIGMKVWELKRVIIPAADAYGEHDDNRTDFILRSDLQSFVDAWHNLEAWEELPTQYGNFTIIDSNEQGVTVDMNHSLAWKTLTFDIELIEIND
jgi:FKBP-type peptidyl-prolyl cis-trans isomerase 2